MVLKIGLAYYWQYTNFERITFKLSLLVEISPDGAAQRDGRLKVGHRVLEVNGQSLLGSTHDEAVKCVRAAGEHVSLLVCYGFDEEDLVSQDDVS